MHTEAKHSPRPVGVRDVVVALFALIFCSLVFLARVQAAVPCEDLDGDGFFVPDNCGTARDCNDDDASTYPGATESCNGVDNDCDGFIDNVPLCDRTCDQP